ncbi:type I polyketide synthase, partial [Parafrankia sp. FMc2]|uniref:type I polyketide synthase n=1 Tax=Parafrankia sp. FMc2 TaxID=3233196 RepID=UPI0034D3DC98
LDLHLDRPLRELIDGVDGDESGLLDQTGYAQPALFAVEVALTALLGHWGVTPDILVGHSIGEIAAAHAAGVLDLADAAVLVAARGRLMQALPAGGAMLAVQAGEAEILAALAEATIAVDLAAVNGPTAVVLSGPEDAIGVAAELAAARGWRSSRLRTSHAFHSALMEPMLAEFAAVVRDLTFREPTLPVVSTVTGRWVEAGEWSDPQYWVRQVREPVRFADAVTALAENGVTRFVESGPDGVLTAMAQQVLPAAEGGVFVPLLRRDRDETSTAVTALARLHVHGVTVDWARVFDGTGATPAENLPTYAFQRQRYWPEPSAGLVVDQPVDREEAEFWGSVERSDLAGLAARLDVEAAALEGVLPALASWRARSRERNAVSGWRYRVVWKPAADPGAAALSGTWLLLGDDTAGLGAELAAAGASLVRVPAGDRAGLTEELRSAVDGVDGPVAGVVSLTGLGADPLLDSLVAVQALGDAGVAAPVWLVTSGAVSTGRSDRPVDPLRAQVWGLGRVVALEHAGRWGGLLDLPETVDRRVAGRVVAVLAGLLGGEDQVAVRGSGVLVRRLLAAPATAAVSVPAIDPASALGVGAGQGWRPRGTVLITGGTGGLGVQVARWAARSGAERLVLVSRRGPAAEGAVELVDELSAAGVAADVLACDLADRAAVAGLLAEVGELSAVVHAAGVGEDRPLADVDADHLNRVVAGKVSGALHLDELLGDSPLDAFVVFSSISGVWGSGEQGAYGAANAALDALVLRRRAAGRVGTAVAWGPWAQVGMAADEAVAGQLRRQGLLAMDPDQAMTAFAQAVGTSDDVVVVADVRWDVFLPVFTAARPRPLFSDLPEAVALATGTAAGGGVVSSLSQQLVDLPAGERERVVVELVRSEVAGVLGHGSAEEVPAGRAFRDLGFDSLTAVELRNRLVRVTGLRLPATLVFDYPNAQRLAEFLLAEVSGAAPAGVLVPVVPASVATTDDPVVIVGMGLRLPGGVDSPDGLWELLADGHDAIGGFPTDRGWNVEELYNPDPDHAGTSYAREGGFLYDAGEFDAGLFGISPREALAMDPQQRLLLETSWEAFERAGIDPTGLRGRPVGVFVGASYMGYGTGPAELPEGLEGHLLTGTASSVISGRLAYTFGLEGPAVTVDTACSSSLVALHLAAQAIRAGEAEMALVGGVTVMPNPGVFVEFSRQRGLSPDGRCRSFAAGADGTGWSEGAGVLLVQRLSDARRAGRRVLAVVRGSAVNQDGASNGLTAPNGPAQQRVIRQALASAGLTPADVDAVEAHGTGTTLGDPIEAQALLATYGQGRPEDQPLWLGSIKSNIGHTQAAAGAAGIMKMILAMRHGTLPATLHVDEPTSNVDWTAGAVELLTASRAWEENGRPRRAGISAFGVSGTNAHVIIEQAPEPEPVPGRDQPAEPAAGTAPAPALPVVPVLVSGHDEAALRDQAGRLAETDIDLLTLGAGTTRRAVLAHRAVVLAAGEDDLRTALEALRTDGSAPNVVRGTAGAGRVAVVFTGQGAQRIGMGRALYETFPVFADAFDAACAHLDLHLDRPLRELIDGGEAELLDQTGYAQPALFAVEVALTALLRHWGVTPDVVVGHSIGEIAAAHTAGVLDLADAALLVAARGRLMQALPSGGAMLAVQADETEALAALAEAAIGVDLAAVNGPSAIVLSGPEEGISAAAALAGAQGWTCTRLRTSHAFHSALMEPMLAEFATVVRGLTLREPELPVVSSLTGRPVGAGEWTDPEYWVRQVREPVRFADAVTALAAIGVTRFVEAGPDGVLTAMAQQVLPDAEGSVFVPLLRRDRDEPVTALTALARLHVHGVAVDWARLFDGAGAPAADLPTYAFQRRRYWLENTPAEATAGDVIEADFWESVERSDLAGLAERLEVDAASLEGVLPALTSWRARRRLAATTDGWRYRIAWKPTADPGPASLSGIWLLVGPEAAAETGVGAEAGAVRLAANVADALTAAGADVVPVPVAPGTDRAELAGRLRSLLMAGSAGDSTTLDGPAQGGSALNGAVAGVVSLAGLSADPLVDSLVVVQALGDAGVAAPVWLVTSGAVSTSRSDRPVEVAQAQVWALGRVAGLERPERWGGLLDLPESLDRRTASRAIAVLAGLPGGEDQVAVRGSGILLRRLAPAPAQREAGWRPRGTVLITGGTGGLGAAVARWAARNGAERLVLVSRRGLAADGAAALVDELSADGVAADVVACDLADRAAVADLLTVAGGLSAVVHAAGVGEDRALAEVDADHLNRVVSGKVAGALHLDELLGDTPLDAFVVFSSISGVWGSGEQAAYGAANAALDALVLRRRAAGRVGTAVAWGPWAQVGMAADEAVADQLRRQGLTAMDPDQAIAVLAQAVGASGGSGNGGSGGAGDDVVVVADVRWDVFLPVFTAARPRPLFSDLPAAVALAGEAAAAGGAVASSLSQRLDGLPAGERERVVVELVRSEVAGVLGHGSADEVSADRAFRELGFDSLTAVELRNRLMRVTGLRLPATLVFDHPNTHRLAAHLLAEAEGTASAGASVIPTLVATTDDPVVIVGMGLRLPGGVDSPAGLWDLLAAGGDAIGGFPTDRGWDLDSLYNPDPDHAGTSYARDGGFLYAAGEFDAGLFGISPREALAMDPQQRLLLETSWEAFERAGVDPTGLRGRPVGVFVGASYMGYGTGLVDAPEGLEGHLLTGTASSVISGRLAYTFGLEGPAVTVDTACSSSLVALHLAAQAIRAGEVEMALVGGVTVMPSPDVFVEFSRQRGLSPDGRCRSFAASADGTGWSEGAGVLLVQRLSDARRDGRRVLAVVRGSAVNQDGASNGLTAPNGPSQQRVIRQALASAGLSPADVDAVEAHGTGTTLGDPIEAQALLATYGQGRPEGQPLWLGSIKSNIGHTQAAAGVAGIIKMVLAMDHGTLPATLHVDEPTTNVDWTAGAIELLTEARVWEESGRPRRAGVSAFGVSGTNAHVILEQASAAEQPVGISGRVLPVVPVLVSGHDEAALRAQAGRFAETDVDLTALGAGSVRRAVLAHRAVILAADGTGFRAGVDALRSGVSASNVVRGVAGSGRLAVVFTGQGAQRIGMGRALYDAFPVFADAFDAVCAHLDLHLDRSVRELIDGDAELLDQTGYAQPALFAVEVALAALLRHWGVTPDVVVGHSIGEIAAAHTAGVLNVADAAVLVAARGRLMQALPAGGAMLAVQAGETEILAALAEAGVVVDLAAVNGPTAVVLSGDAEAIGAAAELAAARGWRSSRLRTSHAFHSALMEPMLAEFATVVRGLTFQEPTLPVVSTVTGRLVGAGEWSDPEYWVRQVREPVRFADAVTALAATGVTRFVEAGPDGVLTAMVGQVLPDAEGSVFVSLLRRDRDETSTALTALAQLHVHGVVVDWARLFDGVEVSAIELPTYAFQRQRFWLELAPVQVVVGDVVEAGFWESVERSDLAGLAERLEVEAASLVPVLPVLPALASWHARRREAAVTDGWQYRVVWKPAVDPGQVVLSGTWLVLGAEAGPDAVSVAVDLGAALAMAGADVMPVGMEPGLDRVLLTERLRALVAGPDGPGGPAGPIAGVVSLTGLGADPLVDSLTVVQALGDADIAAPVWLVTSGAVSTGRSDGVVDPVRAQVWGLGRVVGLEHPD